MIYNKYMENKEKKYKVCWIIALIVTIIASVGFIISTLFLVNYMFKIIMIKNGGNGFGALTLAIFSCISSAISSGISVLGIIFSCIGKKYKAKSGKVMLILNIIYPIIYILFWVTSLIINS